MGLGRLRPAAAPPQVPQLGLLLPSHSPQRSPCRTALWQGPAPLSPGHVPSPLPSLRASPTCPQAKGSQQRWEYKRPCKSGTMGAKGTLFILAGRAWHSPGSGLAVGELTWHRSAGPQARGGHGPHRGRAPAPRPSLSQLPGDSGAFGPPRVALGVSQPTAPW